ncbi:hypothetical protein [Photobacterium leiognathi]|uniref:hypothetical protein n=1 Tax=Photobacterium leiognathi TaxID=553611 RepID=UPI0027386F76|nr:hypothetical protein [Photobacterium leiognathi]
MLLLDEYTASHFFRLPPPAIISNVYNITCCGVDVTIASLTVTVAVIAFGAFDIISSGTANPYCIISSDTANEDLATTNKKSIFLYGA